MRPGVQGIKLCLWILVYNQKNYKQPEEIVFPKKISTDKTTQSQRTRESRKIR